MRLFMLLLPGLCCASAFAQGTAEDKPFSLLVVVDGLRPDLVTAERMPALHQMAEEGVWFEKSHAVFPTVTRVNAASIVTGTYPGTHGILDNTIYMPEVDERPLTTSDWENLKRIEEATGGKLYLVPTLGEILQQHGQKLLVCSAGSTGSAYLLNHHAMSGGGVINTEFTLPESLHDRVLQELGAPPEAGTPNTARNKRAVDALLGVGYNAVKPDVAILWLSDPDHTAHAKGLGAPETTESLATVDAEIARAVGGLRALGHERLNLIVTSDHGFSSYSGTEQYYKGMMDVMRELQLNPNEYVIAGTGIYLKEPSEELITRIVPAFQRKEWVGAVFTPQMSDDQPFGQAMGTMSLSFLRLANARAPHIIVTPAWSDDEAVPGIPGSTDTLGTAGHGGFSAHEVKNTLIALGPAFKKRLKNPLPAGNVDIAPTLLRLQRIEPAASMEGRVLDEALTTGPAPENTKPQGQIFRAQVGFPEGGAYTSEVYETRVFGKRYHSYGKAWRGEAGPPKPVENAEPRMFPIPALPAPLPIPPPAPLPAPSPGPRPGQPALPQ